MPVRNLLQSSTFDPGDVEKLARVFEEVFVTLASPNCESLLREVVARKVIECALEQQEKLFTLQLEALKRSRAALEALSAVLTDEQKKRLDELI
jgi:hypothetical protein